MPTTWTRETIGLDIASASLTVDNIKIDGSTIGHIDDTDLLTLASGALTISGTTTVSGVTTLNNATNVNNHLTVLGAINASAGVRLNNNIIYASDGGATITLDTSDNVTIAGDLTISGGNITNAITCDGTLTSTGVLTASTTFTASATASIAGLLTATSGVKLGNNIIYASDGGTAITLDTSDNVTIGGDLTVGGNDIEFGNGAIIENSSNIAVLAFTTETTYQFKSTSGNDLTLIMYADAGEDDSDKWSFKYADGGNFTVNSYSTGSWVPGLTLTNAGNLTVAGDLTVSGGDITVNNMTSSGFIKCVATEGSSAAIELWADEGDDNADKWQIESAADNTLYFYNYTSGSWASKFNVTSAGIATTADDHYIGGVLYGNGGAIVAGQNSSVQGTLKLWDGSGGNTPGYLVLYSPDGTANYIFCEDDGTLKRHTSAPTANGDGSEIGGQT